MKFEKEMSKHLNSIKKPTLREKRALEILNDPDPGPLRKARIASMEMAARSQLGVGPKAAIDWSQIDWKALLTVILPILLKLFGL